MWEIILILLLVIYFNWKQEHLRIRKIIPRLTKSDKILDLGCGSCCITKRLQDLGYHTVGLDVVNKGKCLTPKIYEGGKLPFSDNSFDVIICSFVLHHIPNYIVTLREMRRVARKKILIFEDTPTNSFDWKLEKLHAGSQWGQCKQCFHRENTWRDIFSENGLRVIRAEPISRFEFPFAGRPFFYPIPATFFVLAKI